MIGKRIVIEYYDQNTQMEEFLPRSGTIMRQLNSKDWGNGWYLVKLDVPFDYEEKIVPVLGHSPNFHVTNFLIKSRWEGKLIECDNETSVFVLLVEKPPLEAGPFDSKEFHQGCWGMVRCE